MFQTTNQKLSGEGPHCHHTPSPRPEKPPHPRPRLSRQMALLPRATNPGALLQMGVS